MRVQQGLGARSTAKILGTAHNHLVQTLYAIFHIISVFPGIIKKFQGFFPRGLASQWDVVR
jgi:hypothetical protein